MSYIYIYLLSRFNSTYGYWILPKSVSLTKKLYQDTLGRTWGFIALLFWWKTNHVLKTDGDQLSKDFLTNKIFSKQILSWYFKMKFCLDRGLVWGFFGWKLIILTVFLQSSEPRQDSNMISRNQNWQNRCILIFKD